MSTAANVYTAAEAAAVSGIGIKSVHNAIDKRIVETVARSSEGADRRRAAAAEALVWRRLRALN